MIIFPLSQEQTSWNKFKIHEIEPDLIQIGHKILIKVFIAFSSSSLKKTQRTND